MLCTVCHVVLYQKFFQMKEGNNKIGTLLLSNALHIAYALLRTVRAKCF